MIKFNPSYTNIWGISYPLILAGIAETVVDITDTIFLAHYGITELAAIGLADAIYGIALFMTLGLVDGIQITIGRRAGEGKPLDIGRVFNQGVYLLLITSSVMLLVILQLVPGLTHAVLESQTVDAAVNQYLQISAFALVFQALNLSLSAFYIGISRTRILIGAAFILAAINVALDYLLIFGNHGFPELGIEGAAIASLCAEIATFAFLAGDTIRRNYYHSYGLFQFKRWNSAVSSTLIRLSTPISLEALVETVRWFGFFLIIERLGEDVLAGANIIYSCYVFFLLPTDALSETVSSMVSNLIGQKKGGALRLFLARIIRLGYLIVAPAVILSVLFPGAILSAFSDDSALVSLSLNSMYVIALGIIAAVPGSAFYAAVASTGDTRVTLIIQLVVTAFTLVIAWLAALSWGLSLEYVWLAEVVGWIVCLLLSWIWFRSEFWKRIEI